MEVKILFFSRYYDNVGMYIYYERLYLFFFFFFNDWLRDLGIFEIRLFIA